MIEEVGILHIALKGIEIDHSTESVAIYNLGKSVNKYIKDLNGLFSSMCLTANSYASAKQTNAKNKKNSPSFKFSSNSFSILVFKNHVAIRYELENEEQISLQSKKEIVCEIFHYYLSHYNRTYIVLSQMTEMNDNAVFEDFGSENIKNYHKSLMSLGKLAESNSFIAEVPGHDPISFDECIEPPSLVKVFSDDSISYDSYKIDGFRRSKLEVYLISGTGKGKGRGDKTISVTVDQLDEVEKYHLEGEHLYDFKVVQSDFNKYKMISFDRTPEPKNPLHSAEVQEEIEIE